MRKILDTVALVASGLMALAGFILIRNNAPAFSPFSTSMTLWLVFFSLFPVVGITHVFRKPRRDGEETGISLRITQALLYLCAAAALPILFTKAAITDYYQPLSLYDVPIYILLIAWLLFFVLFILQAVRAVVGKPGRRGFLLWPMLILMLIAIVPVFHGLSNPEWTDTADDVQVLFEGGKGGYGSYRIPGLLVIPAESMLAGGSSTENDTLLAFVEARKAGSLDQGDIDLLLRRSEDAGRTWSDAELVRHWEDGLGKIGDPTPVFDRARGTIILAMGAQAHGEAYETWLMESEDGGRSWSDAVWLGEGSPGPGHGTVITGGSHDGRLVIPAHKGNSGFAWLSDDGELWRASENSYPGNESLIASLKNGILAYTSRQPQSVAKPHPRLEKLFGSSSDGGESWEEYPASGVVTPICMSGLVSDRQGTLWFVNPATVRTRARLSLRSSDDDGKTWSDPELLFPGPAGYADLGSASDGDVYVLAENGRVEYDERVSFARIHR